MKKGANRRKYSLEFKQEAISLAEKIGVCEAQKTAANFKRTRDFASFLLSGVLLHTSLNIIY